MKGIVASLILLFALSQFPTTSSAFAQANTLIGTWKLDTVKSKIDYGPLPRSEVRTYEATGNNGVKLKVEGTDGNGAGYVYGAAGAIDGKDYPMPGNGTRNGGGSLSWTRVDPYTVDAKVKKSGEVVNTTRLSISADGKVLTITENGTNQSGEATHGVRVYERQ
jgi:hypothetical protein